MRKILILTLLPILLWSHSSLAQISREDRNELFDRVDKMCAEANAEVTRFIRFEGDGRIGGVLKLVGTKLSGSITVEQYENLEQKLEDFRTNPTICQFEAFKLLLPVFQRNVSYNNRNNNGNLKNSYTKFGIALDEVGQPVCEAGKQSGFVKEGQTLGVVRFRCMTTHGLEWFDKVPEYIVMGRTLIREDDIINQEFSEQFSILSAPMHVQKPPEPPDFTKPKLEYVNRFVKWMVSSCRRGNFKNYLSSIPSTDLTCSLHLKNVSLQETSITLHQKNQYGHQAYCSAPPNLQFDVMLSEKFSNGAIITIPAFSHTDFSFLIRDVPIDVDGLFFCGMYVDSEYRTLNVFELEKLSVSSNDTIKYSHGDW